MISSLRLVWRTWGRWLSPADFPSTSRRCAVSKSFDMTVYAPCFDARFSWSILGGSPVGLPLAGYRRATSLLVGPGIVPRRTVYSVLTGPYRRNPPLGVTSAPLFPIFKICLLCSVLWANPIWPGLGTEYIT